VKSEPAFAARLRSIVTDTDPLLRQIPEAESATRPAPGKWSPREIIGHLIDSASINHQRFVRAAFQDDLVFQGYDQDKWVDLQKYQEASWSELVSLWTSFNLRLASLMAVIPESVRIRTNARHNLQEIAFRTDLVPVEPTLDFFMADYVEHLEHHLRQIPGSDSKRRLM
jgi:hypothetical protein